LLATDHGDYGVRNTGATSALFKELPARRKQDRR
jgi:hypothetical protein